MAANIPRHVGRVSIGGGSLMSVHHRARPRSVLLLTLGAAALRIAATTPVDCLPIRRDKSDSVHHLDRLKGAALRARGPLAEPPCLLSSNQRAESVISIRS